ncbi:c-type cytochrome [Rhodopila sp.]|uniref:c-type cytochrome n=1 Tax=Rhodopila sp. TaxID=2480087 RepID=UPI003D0D7896
MLAVIGLVATMAGGARAEAAAAPDAGATIAQKGNDRLAPCATCHGAQGEGNAAIGGPRLAGLGASYIVEQLDAFADKSRGNPIMLSIAQSLPVAERAAVAAYFSSLPSPGVGAPDAAAGSLGARLALRGRWSEQLPGCEQCHGPGGAGISPAFPPLAGLPARYIEAQLQAWKTATRPPGPLGLMAAVAGRLSNEDIAAVAGYFASMKVTPQSTSIKSGAIGGATP